MSKIDEFFNLLEWFRKGLLWAVGGSAILPLIAGFAGLSPPWPPALPLLTGLYILIAVSISYLMASAKSNKSAQKALIFIIATATIALIGYLSMLSYFTHVVPTTGERIFVGCGWSEQTLRVVGQYGADAAEGCPGVFGRVLAANAYEAEGVWRPSSIRVIRIITVALWVAFFTFYSLGFGLFLRTLQRQR